MNTTQLLNGLRFMEEETWLRQKQGYGEEFLGLSSSEGSEQALFASCPTLVNGTILSIYSMSAPPLNAR